LHDILSPMLPLLLLSVGSLLWPDFFAESRCSFPCLSCAAHDSGEYKRDLRRSIFDLVLLLYSAATNVRCIELDSWFVPVAISPLCQTHLCGANRETYQRMRTSNVRELFRRIGIILVIWPARMGFHLLYLPLPHLEEYMTDPGKCNCEMP
jgi:hypothetical protein